MKTQFKTIIIAAITAIVTLFFVHHYILFVLALYLLLGKYAASVIKRGGGIQDTELFIFAYALPPFFLPVIWMCDEDNDVEIMKEDISGFIPNIPYRLRNPIYKIKK